VFARIPGLTDLVVQGPHARFRTADVNRALAELVRAVDAEHATIVDLRVQRGSLEDVFVQLTREAHAEAAP